MAKREHDQSKQPPAGRALLLSPEKAARLSALLERFDIEPDPTQFQKYTRGGKVFFRYREPGRDPSRGGGGADYAHPFKMLTAGTGEDLVLHVRHGQVQRMDFSLDSDGQIISTFQRITVDIGSGYLIGDPEDTVPVIGEIALAASTTYGVWLAAAYPSTPTSTPGYEPYVHGGGARIPQWVDWLGFPFATSAEIIASSDYPDPGDWADITASTARIGYIYLGRVVVDGDSLATITQDRRSDIILPAYGMPYKLISGASNDLTTDASDGGLYYLDP